MQTRRATITPYMCQEEFFIPPTKCWVIKGMEYPDPLKRMLQGMTAKGEIISNYKKYFKKAGRAVTLSYVSGARTAMEEKQLKLKAVHEYICKDAGGQFRGGKCISKD